MSAYGAKRQRSDQISNRQRARELQPLADSVYTNSRTFNRWGKIPRVAFSDGANCPKHLNKAAGERSARCSRLAPNMH